MSKKDILIEMELVWRTCIKHSQYESASAVRDLIKKIKDD